MSDRGWLIAGGSLVLASLLGVWLSTLRHAQIDRAPMLPVNFAHLDHQEVNCIDCHHNFVDTTGDGLCFDCHKRDPDIAPAMEQMFHDLCRGCHTQRQHDDQDAGPQRACFSCHEGDQLP
jgi:hypothetical protein